MGLLTDSGLRLRLVDSTRIQEPGDTGSDWRVFYSLGVPNWQCDFFRLTPARGVGHGESLKYFPVRAGDCLLADRGFSHLAGIDHVQRCGGRVIVRLNDQSAPLEDADGHPVVLLNLLRDTLWTALSISDCLARWHDTQRDLAEARRNRVPRIKCLLS